ncbi:MAG: hypothetical protein NC131_17005 [Roseburia sp.]|nr:hypothetical protein [Roseburia sp.]
MADRVSITVQQTWAVTISLYKEKIKYMLEVFKEKMGNLKNPEWFFNNNVKAFDLSSEENKLVIRVMENAEVLQDKVLDTPMGKGRVKDMKTATKLALCLVNYPGLLFDSANISVRDMEKILALPRGSVYLDLKEPLPYLFKVQAKTGSGVLLNTSTDVNIWFFTGRRL